MRTNQILRNSIDLLIFKPVLVLFCKIIGIPHVYVIIVSIALLAVLVLVIGKVNKIISLLLITSLVILAMLVMASKNPSEYLYNILLAFNFFLILLLFSVNKGFENNYSSLFWRIALAITLLASCFDALLFNSLTKFEGRNTLVGYENPLWAARDLGIIIFYLSLKSNGVRIIEIGILLGTILFFLEARAVFLISLFLLFVRITPANLAIGLSILASIAYSIININPYSFSKRIVEWSNIISNLDQIPFAGFGGTNYAQIPFTSMTSYPHNWVLEILLGYGAIGLVFSILILINLYRLLKLKNENQLHYLMALPIFYVLTGLSQGSLISCMLGLSLMPAGLRLNRLLFSINTYKQMDAR